MTPVQLLAASVFSVVFPLAMNLANCCAFKKFRVELRANLIDHPMRRGRLDGSIAQVGFRGLWTRISVDVGIHLKSEK
jgi:hypothetical protein